MTELSPSILAIMYFGDVVFAVSGALTAGKNRMDVLGFVLIGTITGIGGGTTRDLLLGRTVWWTQNPEELILCFVAALITFFFVRETADQSRWMIWSDALGLASFGLVGCHVALEFGAPFLIAVFMGMVTATGGGVIRDTITNQRPMIMCGQLYATAALTGALVYGVLVHYLGAHEIVAEVAGFGTAFALRAAAIIFDIRMGPPGEFIKIGKRTGN
ncbi:MAG: trimeric intracellular cation channel family protein [Desulfuromonadales bacterium]|nr:trimeric intracellular cation channel family protein [Desulfuromonadales bacterium]MDH3868185.1 trimeric intracellular cation channel family protein [Desulfuromonadales bacterium]MDH4025640.1 trimeric intracellular cation channel family protein [Desulfuromonadales bacterium]HKJ29625.1 trimeric intracellular cation channel family protein [Desulfuromonadales bacterium]